MLQPSPIPKGLFKYDDQWYIMDGILFHYLGLLSNGHSVIDVPIVLEHPIPELISDSPEPFVYIPPAYIRFEKVEYVWSGKHRRQIAWKVTGNYSPYETVDVLSGIVDELRVRTKLGKEPVNASKESR